MPKNKSNKPLYPSKDHQDWAKLKSQIHNNISRHTPYKEGEIYWFYFGNNIGVEEDGKNEFYSRPGLIVRGFSEALIWVIPLSHTKRTNRYYSFEYYDRKGRKAPSKALLSHLRAFDAARISGRSMGRVDRRALIAIKKQIARFILAVRNYPD